MAAGHKSWPLLVTTSSLCTNTVELQVRTVSRGCSCLVWICCFADYTSFSLCPWMQMTKLIFSSRSILRFRRVFASELHFAQLLQGQEDVTLSCFWEQGLISEASFKNFCWNQIGFCEMESLHCFFSGWTEIADPVSKGLCESWWGCLRIRHPHWSTPEGFFLNHHRSSGPQILRHIVVFFTLWANVISDGSDWEMSSML